MKFPGFASGGTYQAFSTFAAAEEAINLMVEELDNPNPNPNAKAKLCLRTTPGLILFGTATDVAFRGGFCQDGRAYAVFGATLFEVFTDGTMVSRGTVSNDGRRVSFASNGLAGNQILLISGGLAYIFNISTNILTQIADVDFPSDVSMVIFIDGYFLVLKRNTGQFNFSDLENGLVWDGTDIAIRSAQSDNFRAMLLDHKEIWFFGSKSTELYYDSGAANTPFQPIPSVFVEQGICSEFAATKFDNSVTWVHEDKDGGRMVWRANGHTPQIISTRAIDRILGQFSTVSDLFAWTYQLDGHSCLVLTSVLSKMTLVYDASVQMWHKWQYYNTTSAQFEAHRCAGGFYAFGKYLAGDRENGKLYQLSFDAYDDAGLTRRWLRRAPLPYIGTGGFIYPSEFRLVCHVGAGLSSGQGSDPMAMFRMSTDSGNTWGSERLQSLGKQGEYKTLVTWQRLGKVRDGDGVIEVSGTDAIKMVILGAEIEAEQGDA